MTAEAGGMAERAIAANVINGPEQDLPDGQISEETKSLARRIVHDTLVATGSSAAAANPTEVNIGENSWQQQ